MEAGMPDVRASAPSAEMTLRLRRGNQQRDSCARQCGVANSGSSVDAETHEALLFFSRRPA
jgi:hypothetical protein